MKRSTERYVIAAVALLLIALLAVPLLVLLVAFNQEKLCTLGNLMRDDPADRAATQIKDAGPGQLDFRALKDEYDRICLIDIDSEVSIEGRGVGLFRLAGRPLCGGFKKNSPVFALMSGASYTPMRYRFDSLPVAPHPLPQRTSSCVPTGEAVVHCFRRGDDGNLCVFGPTE